ncbi:adenosylcobinamide-phosphate synthase CbiB [Zongyangia hominis]|uniref:Cobalamin biosynthesis protein CobD n=1 Tax=Zongyangia hominis TaxID=2763677 RepID=A0A926E8K2_9FIRM|nr:adenosylcobinamide-phosphate synthase CbiB [Zongyangia hominis]MBC8569302.1 cobalamin biosynthesis protein CobD [Zongyangia hominis]
MTTEWLCALGVGVLLDLCLGDPHWMPHPVRLMGTLIGALEKGLRSLFPATPAGEKRAGVVLVTAVLVLSTGAPALLLWICGLFSTVLRFVVESWMCYQLMAAKSLYVESARVQRALEAGDLPLARRRVSMIVGRDTEKLDEAGVAKAAVETVAENTSDGVIAPLFYMALGGPVLGFFYKAVNTMDSMVGYQNEKYLHFGRCAAKLDDVMNFIPARLSALLMILAAGLTGHSPRRAARIWRRDRRKHKSPNSAQTEAVCAGALGLELAGDAYYFGKRVKKPAIGDPVRPIEPKDIGRAGRLMFVTELLSLLVCGGGMALLILSMGQR